jgi:hypothetical protein
VEGWQLGVAILSLVALIVIGVATVWIAVQSRRAANRTVELAEAAAKAHWQSKYGDSR